MQTLTKSERLGNFRLQKMLFSQGNSFFCHPFRVVYLVLKPDELPADISGLFHYPIKTIFPVPARNIRKATARNRVRRLVKESFRKNKSGLYSFLNNRHEICLLALVYSVRQILPFREMESKIKLSLHRLEETIQNNGGRAGDPAKGE